tara:strand:+ start:50 stop:190 length:141 start_codon:yes stop_codon:yes gene_type:complete
MAKKITKEIKLEIDKEEKEIAIHNRLFFEQITYKFFKQGFDNKGEE